MIQLTRSQTSRGRGTAKIVLETAGRFYQETCDIKSTLIESECVAMIAFSSARHGRLN